MPKFVLNGAVFVVLIGLFAFAANDWRAPWAGKPVHGADWCKPHDVLLVNCEKCNPRLARGGTQVVREREPNKDECPNTLVRITLGPDVARQINLQFHSLELRTLAETLAANAETQYPPSRYSRVAPRISGVIRDVSVVLGDDVERGAPLATIESSEFGQAKADHLRDLAVLKLRQQTYEREKSLFEAKVASGRQMQEAKTALEEAELTAQHSAQRLGALGLSADQIKQVVDAKDTSPVMQVVAPFKGSVVEASAVPGEIAAPDRPIFGVADVGRLWLSIDVYEADLSRVEKEQRVTFTVSGLPNQRFPGKIVAIAGEVDDRTRTVRVFADVKNVQGLLKAKMFGRAEISVKAPEPKLLVPRDAVQNDGDCTLVFVSPVPDIFQARKVQLGTAYENGFEVLGGLAEGERVVTTGSFLLKTEVLRGQIGAG